MQLQQTYFHATTIASRDDFVEDFSTDEETEDQEEEEDPNKLWEVENVLDSHGEGEQQEVLVKWKNFISKFDCWPELKSFIQQNQANPDSTSLARCLVPVYNPDDEFTLSIRQAVIDELGHTRATPHTECGRAKICLLVMKKQLFVFVLRVMAKKHQEDRNSYGSVFFSSRRRKRPSET